MLNHLTVLHTNDVDDGDSHRPACGRHAHEVAGVCTSEDLARHHLIALGDHVFDCHLTIREACSERRGELLDAFAIGRHTGRSAVVHSIGCYQLVCSLQDPLVLDLFHKAVHQRLVLCDH